MHLHHHVSCPFALRKDTHVLYYLPDETMRPTTPCMLSVTIPRGLLASIEPSLPPGPTPPLRRDADLGMDLDDCDEWDKA